MHSSLVLFEVVWSCELSLAFSARERTFAGVTSYVAPHHVLTEVLSVARSAHVDASAFVISHVCLPLKVPRLLGDDGGSTSAFVFSCLYFVTFCTRQCNNVQSQA